MGPRINWSLDLAVASKLSSVYWWIENIFANYFSIPLVKWSIPLNVWRDVTFCTMQSLCNASLCNPHSKIYHATFLSEKFHKYHERQISKLWKISFYQLICWINPLPGWIYSVRNPKATKNLWQNDNMTLQTQKDLNLILGFTSEILSKGWYSTLI